MIVSGNDQKILEKIHRVSLELEKTARDGDFPQAQIKILKNLLLECQSSDVLKRLSKIELHLHEKMTLRQFVTFMVPVERLLNRSLKDDDFLVSTMDRDISETPTLPLIFVLDNIRSAFNVGSIFRTAECLNIDSIYLCGYTPTPEQEKIAKTAMGTETLLTWKIFGKIEEAIDDLHTRGFRIIALETADRTVDFYNEIPMTSTAFIFGNERFGIDPHILNLVDEVRSIPLRGQKNSLNVGVTAAIAGFEWTRQWTHRSSILESLGSDLIAPSSSNGNKK